MGEMLKPVGFIRGYENYVLYDDTNYDGEVNWYYYKNSVDKHVTGLESKCTDLQKNIDELCAIHAIEEDRMFADCKHAKYMLWCKRAESARWAMLRYKALHAFGDISRYGLDGYVHKGFAGKVNHTAYEWLIIWFKVMTLCDKKVLEYKDIVE
jgi:hypothetical protein